MNPETYGEQISQYYDDLYPPHSVPEILAFIQELVPVPARAVDFGVGTGRTAIPMARAGYHVRGIDISPAMLAVLDDKDPESLVRVTLGDFNDVAGSRDSDLVLILNSTLFMAPDISARQRTFDAATTHLQPGERLSLRRTRLSYS